MSGIVTEGRVPVDLQARLAGRAYADCRHCGGRGWFRCVRNGAEPETVGCGNCSSRRDKEERPLLEVIAALHAAESVATREAGSLRAQGSLDNDPRWAAAAETAEGIARAIAGLRADL